MTPFYTILTNYGKTALAEAWAAQQPLEIPHMAVGDGGGAYYEPVEEQTNLRNERWRGDLNDLRTDEEYQGQVIAEAIIPHDIEDGDWTAREVGLFDAKGGLVAVGKYPETYIPSVLSGAKSQVYINIIIKVDNVAAVELIVNHDTVLASKQFVISKGMGIVGSFHEGLSHIGALTNPYQLVYFKEEDAFYRWLGSLPKSVPALSTPQSTGGIGLQGWQKTMMVAKDLSYFMGVSSSDVEALDNAITYTNLTGEPISSGNIKSLQIDRLPRVSLLSGAKLHFDGLCIKTNIANSPKGSGVFSGSGTVDTEVYADLTLDIEPYQTTLSLTHAGLFSVGDFISARYTVRQNSKVVATNDFGDDFNLYEYSARIVAISGNTITVDVGRSYKVFSSPPNGGVFRVYLCHPIKDIEISGVTVIDENNAESASHSVVALYFSANHKIEDVCGENMKGTIAYFENCYGHYSLNTASIRPRSTSAGRGYTEQHLACSKGLSVYPRGEQGRHVIDYAAGSTGMTVRGGSGKSMKDGVFGCHGSFENNITYSECEADSSPQSPMFYLATSGEVFGNQCKDIKIISPRGRGMGSLLYTAAAEARPQNVSIIDPDYKEHAGNGFAIRCNMSDMSIRGGYIEGGIQVAALFAPNDYRTDFVIDNAKITPDRNGVLLQTGDTFGQKIVFKNSDTSGMVVLTAPGIPLNFYFGTYTYLSPSLIHPASTTQKMGQMIMEGVVVHGEVMINDRWVANYVKLKNVNYTQGLLGNIEVDSVAEGEAHIVDTHGDVTFVARRMKKFSYDNNKPIVGTNQKLKIIQSPGSELMILNNDLNQPNAEQLCIDIQAPEQPGMVLIFHNNVHNGKVNFADNSPNAITKGTVVGNVYTGAGTQSVAPNLVKSANYGYN